MSPNESGGWRMIDTGKAPPEENMAVDAALLHGMGAEPKPILHLYDWEGECATYGYFIDPEKLLNRQAIEGKLITIARRPTGGGVIFHVSDWAFSLLVPASHPAYSVNTLDSYAFVNRLVIEVVERFAGKSATLGLLPEEPAAAGPDSRHFCMAKPTKYDVMLDGRKVGGGAQRRTKEGFLHQGTISLALPDEQFLKRVLLSGNDVEEQMRRFTCSLIGEKASLRTLAEARKELSRHFRQILEES